MAPRAYLFRDLHALYSMRFSTFQFKAVLVVVLVVLRLNVPVNNFSVMSGRSHRFLGN